VARLEEPAMSESVEFDRWLVENYGFDSNTGSPICWTPPTFVRADGMFDVDAHDLWREQRRKEWEKTR
jgi:hypothetical protein